MLIVDTLENVGKNKLTLLHIYSDRGFYIKNANGELLEDAYEYPYCQLQYTETNIPIVNDEEE